MVTLTTTFNWTHDGNPVPPVTTAKGTMSRAEWLAAHAAAVEAQVALYPPN